MTFHSTGAIVRKGKAPCPKGRGAFFSFPCRQTGGSARAESAAPVCRSSARSSPFLPSVFAAHRCVSPAAQTPPPPAQCPARSEKTPSEGTKRRSAPLRAPGVCPPGASLCPSMCARLSPPASILCASRAFRTTHHPPSRFIAHRRAFFTAVGSGSAASSAAVTHCPPSTSAISCASSA